jgi:uncharacterized membrane protein YphA (DoxX/SURF4 family)
MKNKLILFLRLVAAAILLQTLFFKFTGAPESKFIFSTLGVEPWGRWFSGAVELIASALLLISATQLLGALIAISVMAGAILSHIFVLGLVIQDDGGLLFGLACAVATSSGLVIVLQPDQVQTWLSRGLMILKPAVKPASK